MANDYSSVSTFPYIARFQVDGVDANKATEIILPRQCSRVQIGGETNVTKLAYSGTDGSAMGDFVHVKIPADNLLSLRIGRGTTRNEKLYIASATAGTHVSIILEEL